MREQRRLHHVEGVAIAAVQGVEMREQAQAFGLGLVAAPDRGERLQRRDHVLARHAAGRRQQLDLAQPALRRGAAVLGGDGGAILLERVVLAAEAFGETAAQHVDRRLQVGRYADRVELVEQPSGAGVVLHLDRRAQRLLHRQPLQLERQRRHRAVETLEVLARLVPLALAGEGDAAPQPGVLLVADARRREVLDRLVGPVDEDFGHRAQDAAGDVVAAALVGDGDVEHRLGLRRHALRQIEAREIEARLLARGRRRRRGFVQELGLARQERGVLVEAPELRIEAHVLEGRDRSPACRAPSPTATARADARCRSCWPTASPSGRRRSAARPRPGSTPAARSSTKC